MTQTSETATSYYRDLGDGRWESTEHAQGAWNPNEQHMAPATGIIVRELLRHEPREDMRIVRISCEILGMIPAGEFEITTTTLRPGRTIELIQAEMTANGRTCIRANAWRLVTSDTSAVAGSNDEPLPGPDTGEHTDMTQMWDGGFIRSLSGVALPGRKPGRGRVWLTNDLQVVEGEEPNPLETLLGMADASNGIATRVDPSSSNYIFPNVDLQIHLYREPVGRWLGLDTSVDFGPDGVGLTSSVLHDEQGPFGKSLQILTVRELPQK